MSGKLRFKDNAATGEDNAGVKIAHRAELLGGNAVSRFFQKRRIKRQYAAALKNAKKSAQTAKQTVGIATKATNIATGIIRRNPALLAKVGLLLLIIFIIMSLTMMCMSLFSGGGGFMSAASYSADEEDIDNASLLYTELETDMRLEIINLEIINAEINHGGYDEYRYNISNTGHDPFELIAFLTAVYGEFSYAEIEPVLREIFAEQYALTFMPSAETRYYYKHLRKIKKK